MSQILQKIGKVSDILREQEALRNGTYPKGDDRPRYVSKRRPEAAREL